MSSGSDSEMPSGQLAINLGLDHTTSGHLSYHYNPAGIDLFVDLGDLPISASPTIVESLGASVSRDPLQQSDLQGCCHEPSNIEKSGIPLHDTEVLKGHSLVKEKNNQEGETGAEPDTKIATQFNRYGWPDWGEPLPPEESPVTVDDHDHVDHDVMEKSSVIKKVTFSDVVTFLEPGKLQEERGTGFCSFNMQVDQVTTNSDRNPADVSSFLSSITDLESSNPEDVAAACLVHMKLSNLQECGDSGERDSEVLGVSQGGGECQSYDPSYDLEKLSWRVENMYADLPQLSILASNGGDLKEVAGTWSIAVSEVSLKLKMKRIMPEQGFEDKSSSSRTLDSDAEELETPHRKRKYKSVRTL